MKNIRIGTHLVGDHAPCFLVAEIGINHNGSMDLAKKMIDAAADAGANGVKFQNYCTEDFILDRSLTYRYPSRGAWVVESQYEMFKRCELDHKSLRELKEHCDRRGVVFHSTPTSPEGVRDLVEIGTSVLKNGSDFLTHLDLIECMGRTRLPGILSAGMATLGEIEEAVEGFRQTGNDRLVLLHCVSSYPTPPEDTHLRKIPALAATFDCLTGFSDHTSGTTAAIGAVVLGACWLEKHFTLDRSLPGPDHQFSSDPIEFGCLIRAVRDVEKCLGTSRLGFTAKELESRRDFRLSCVAARDLACGYTIREEDVVFRRPGTGLPPGCLPILAGRCLRRDVAMGEVIQWSDI
jgi:N-acetylneuraminate synthase/N,N'-diacetyllegionaminate synthase